MNLFHALAKLKPGNTAARRHARHECYFPAKMHFLDHGFDIDGFINEISVSGLRFRSAQVYLMRRSSSIVRIHTADYEFVGILRNASPKGYGIELRVPIEEEQLQEIVGKFPPNAR